MRSSRRPGRAIACAASRSRRSTGADDCSPFHCESRPGSSATSASTRALARILQARGSSRPRVPRVAGPVESPTRCPCDSEGRSASASRAGPSVPASRLERQSRCRRRRDRFGAASRRSVSAASNDRTDPSTSRACALMATSRRDPTRGSSPAFVRASEAGTASCVRECGSGRAWCSVVSLGGEGTQVGVCGVERDAELLWVASGLGEDEPALDGGEGRCRETGGVCAAPELAVGLHLSKPVS